jgi:hypothetical protein
MAEVSINKQEIARMTREIQREFDKYSIRVPVQVDSPVPPGGFATGSTTIFNGPVIHGDANGAKPAGATTLCTRLRTGPSKPRRGSRLSPRQW